MSQRHDIPRQVVEAVRRAVARSQEPPGMKFLDVLRALGELDDVDATDSPTFRIHEYEIYVARQEWLSVRKGALSRIGSLGLTIAPELVEDVALDTDGGALIARYVVCPGERLRRVDAVHTTLREEAVQRFRRDLQRLVEHGLVHPFARGLHHWLVSSETGSLVLDEWYALRECTPEEGREFLQMVDGLVASRRRQEALAVSYHGSHAPGATLHRIREVFGVDRVLLPVIHPVSRETALASTEVAVKVGCRGIFLIDQGMSRSELLKLVVEARHRFTPLWVGVNLLGLPPAEALTTALEACEDRIDGLWTDNAGIDEREPNQPAAEAFMEVRRARGWNGLYFGGVAFKYQRAVEDGQLAHAVRCATPFMDVICTSGPGTGQEARVDKVRTMREALGPESALALASGVTTSNALDYTPYVNAFLVGTGVESSFGVLDPHKVWLLQGLVSGPPKRVGERA